MNQCVPSWDLDNNSSPSTARLTLHAVSNTDSAAAAAAVVADDSTLDYEVAELIWANGQLGLQGLGPPRIGSKTIPTLVSSSSSKYSWPEKPRAGGTLESIVSQAAHLVPSKSISHVSNGVTTVCGGGNQPAPWFNQQESAASAALPHPISMDALVPCSNPTPSTADDDDDDNDDDNDDDHPSSQVPNTDSSTPVGSCSTPPEKQATRARKRAKVAHEGSSKNNSPSASETFALDSISMRDPTLDTCDVELDVTSLGSRENTSTVKPWASSTKPSTVVGDDSVCHSRPYKLKKRESREEEERKKSQSGKSSVKTKRSRAADIHNQSERRRRDKINQRMKTLQKMIPNSSKTDKASMLDEVIEYLKQLQAQVQMMSRMIPQMMLPMSTMQQQLQMSMLAQMGMAGIGMGMGMGVMDMNLIARPNLPTIPSVLHPTAFMPLASWDVSGDHRTSTSNANMSSDPLSSFLACQSQSMTMDSYNRMAALFQQLHPSPTSNTKT